MATEVAAVSDVIPPAAGTKVPGPLSFPATKHGRRPDFAVVGVTETGRGKLGRGPSGAFSCPRSAQEKARFPAPRK
ncbi:hypothetical protein GCM10022227_38360 [Streptomyces sedi]